MVHSMDAMSSKWRDDPVRAINEKKKQREASAAMRSEAQAKAVELLTKKLTKAQNGVDGRDLEAPAAMDHDAAYRLVSLPTSPW